MVTGCEKSKDINGSETKQIINFPENISVWESTPDPNVTITLTIDSEENMMYSNVVYRDSVYYHDYLFLHGDIIHYEMQKDTMFFLTSTGSIEPYDIGFIIIMHSTDSMTMKPWGIVPCTLDIITDYLFIRRTSKY
jgi:hypothetical protein